MSHVTRTPLSRSKNVERAGAYCGGLPHSFLLQPWCLEPYADSPSLECSQVLTFLSGFLLGTSNVSIIGNIEAGRLPRNTAPR